MAKKSSGTSKAVHDSITDPEFTKHIEKAVRKRWNNCIDRNQKTSKWFKSFAECCTALAVILEDAAVGTDSNNLHNVREMVVDVQQTTATALYRPLVNNVKILQEEQYALPATATKIFDQICELVYPEKTETQRGGSSTKDTVQEFEKKLTEEEIEKIDSAIDWASNLSTPVDACNFRSICNLSVREMLLYLRAKGYGRNELARQLDLPTSAVTRMSRGENEPAESVARRIRFFLINLPE